MHAPAYLHLAISIFPFSRGRCSIVDEKNRPLPLGILGVSFAKLRITRSIRPFLVAGTVVRVQELRTDRFVPFVGTSLIVRRSIRVSARVRGKCSSLKSRYLLRYVHFWF